MSAGEAIEMTPVEQALAGGIPQRIGGYRFFFADERWEWSPEVESMHGYAPGTARPTTAMVLEHKHPEDREQVAATLGEILVTHKAFCTRHRIITESGEIREVLVVSQPIEEGVEVVGTQGFYIDVTPGREELISEAVAEITGQRAVIEQVKGVLCVVYRVDPDAAFDLLRWRSQQTNVKLRALAEQLMSDFRSIGGGQQLPDRETFDHVLMTAHLRVASADDQDGEEVAS